MPKPTKNRALEPSAAQLALLWALSDGALYGMAELYDQRVVGVSPSGYYALLSRLETCGYVQSSLVPRPAGMAGRSRRQYRITPEGLRCVKRPRTAGGLP